MLSDHISAAISELEEGLEYLVHLPGYHHEVGDEARIIGILSDLFELLFALDNPRATRVQYGRALQQAKRKWLALICPVQLTKPSISDILLHSEENRGITRNVPAVNT